MSYQLDWLLANMETTADVSGADINDFLCDGLTAAIAADLRTRLAEKQQIGKYGWWSSKVCSIEDLEAGLKRGIERHEILDIIAYAGMIYAREKFIDKKGLNQNGN